MSWGVQQARAAGLGAAKITRRRSRGRMTILSDAISAIREALQLADDVKPAAETLKELTREVREQDRRITRLEAQWDTAIVLAGRGAATPGSPESPR